MGLIYAATQLNVLGSVGDSWKDRSEYIASVERGDKPLRPQQALGLLRLSLEVEAKRTAAITASRDLLVELSAIAVLCCGVLVFGIRSVPREHWPRMSFGRSSPE